MQNYPPGAYASAPGPGWRPAKIKTAATLLYISLALGLLRGFWEWPANKELSLLVYLIVAVVLAVLVLFIYLIGRGVNWARIVMLVLFLIGLPFAVLDLPHKLTAQPVPALVEMGQVAAQVVAFVLLFARDANAWFRAMKPRRR
ncbi:MAG: hypothetical protein C4525_13265 [Desulfarculus sp.]|nr:MAG: hypothetical protein C4525_13265 [Desulfarculus sp.]